MKTKSAFRTLLGFALFLLLSSGCASFKRDWNQTLAARTAPVNLEGPWEGTWRSDATGHHDLLQCLITRKNGGDYQARFHAKYHTVFTFNYTVPLTVQATNHLFHFQSSANLGWLAGGLYQYDGTASTTNFNSIYTSKYDHGFFQMSRPR